LPEKCFQDIEYHYDNILVKLNVQTLHIRRRHYPSIHLVGLIKISKNNSDDIAGRACDQMLPEKYNSLS
jgi:hypothetical protein